MVLVTGGNIASADLFDPTTETFTATSSMNDSRLEERGVFLSASGQVLVTGGTKPQVGTLNSAELFSP